MPIELQVDAANRRIVARVIGDFTLADIRQTIDSSLEHPELGSGFSVLSDHSEVGEPLTTAQAHAMVSHLRSRSEELRGTRWAVVTHKHASYGMLRMLSVLLEEVPIEVRIFDSRASAEAWLAGSPKVG